MRKRTAILIAVVLLGLLCWSGIGYHRSASAVLDLKEALKALHGEPYTGREVENGTEDMEFIIKPASFLFTNWNLRNFFSWDYRYQCEVIYTVHPDGENDGVERTMYTYTGFDPMGPGKEAERAYLDTEHVTIRK